MRACVIKFIHLQTEMHIEGWIKDIIEKTILQDWVAVICTNCSNLQHVIYTRFSISGSVNVFNLLSIQFVKWLKPLEEIYTRDFPFTRDSFEGNLI